MDPLDVLAAVVGCLFGAVVAGVGLPILLKMNIGILNTAVLVSLVFLLLGHIKWVEFRRGERP